MIVSVVELDITALLKVVVNALIYAMFVQILLLVSDVPKDLSFNLDNV